MQRVIIIGAGPTGLTLAWLLSPYYNVTIIEKENTIGGCHRVKRTNNGLFSEHGPRIYVGNYFLFNQLLTDMDLNFEDLFVPYNFSSITLAFELISSKVFTLNEYYNLFWTLINLSDDDKSMTMQEYLTKHKFSQVAINYIDKLCRITDGANIDRYTVYNFMQIINTKFFYKIYQPKEPNDIELFQKWQTALTNNNVNKIILISYFLYILIF